MGEDLCSHPQPSCHFAPGLDLALGEHLLGMDVCFRRSITMMHTGRNAVRWVKKEQRGGTQELLGLQKSSWKAGSFPSLQ